ncbi:MAG: hypothetical protein WD069_19980 [Planctomycetales bacterium]
MSDVIRLGEIAHARSGDKGNHANVGVIAYTAAGYEHLGRVLTADRVAEFFAPLGVTRVERFALPGIHAYNFLLHDALGGGASRSLRTDTQGKTLGPALLEMEIPGNHSSWLTPSSAPKSPAASPASR